MSHFKFYSAHEGSIRHEYYAQDLPLFQEFLRLISSEDVRNSPWHEQEVRSKLRK